jgi:hypothetical protein
MREARAETTGGRIHASGPVAPKQSRIRATVGAGLWTVSAVLLLIILRLMHSDAPQLFAALEVDLPVLTRSALQAATFVSDGKNLLIIAGALVLTLTPFAFGVRGKTAAKFYFTLTFLAVLGIAGTWFAVNQPLNLLSDKLDAHATPIGR